MPAVAVTDTNNLFGAYEIADTLIKAGIQPITGCRCRLNLDEPAPMPPAPNASRAHLALLVKDEAGYRNLSRLFRAAYLEAEPGDWPHVNRPDLPPSPAD